MAANPGYILTNDPVYQIGLVNGWMRAMILATEKLNKLAASGGLTTKGVATLSEIAVELLESRPESKGGTKGEKG